MSERATRVGVKLEPPTLIVIYALDEKSRIRKIPLKMAIDGKRVGEIVDALMSRQNHATLLRSIKRETLLNVIGKLPGAILEPVVEEEPAPAVEDNIDDLLGMVQEKPKPKFTMPLLSESEEESDNIDDLLGFTKKEPEEPKVQEKTKFSFLDSDEDDFKPLPQEVETEHEEEEEEKSRASSVASWLKSTENDKTEQNYDDDEFTTKSTSTSSSSVSESEIKSEQIIDENPYLANLQASAAAARRSGSTASTVSDSEVF